MSDIMVTLKIDKSSGWRHARNNNNEGHPIDFLSFRKSEIWLI